MKPKKDQQVIFLMKFEHIQRVCIGIIETIYDDVKRAHVRVIDSVQFPEYNAISWNNHPTLDYDELVRYTHTKWLEIKATVDRLRQNQSLLKTLLSK